MENLIDWDKINSRVLQVYRNAIDDLFEKKCGVSLPCTNSDQLQIIDEMIFKYAPDNGTIYVLVNDLTNEFFGNASLIKAVQKAFLRNISICVCYTNKMEQCDFVKVLMANKVNPVKVKNLGINFLTNMEGLRVNFDDLKSERIAFAPESAKLLAKLFHDKLEAI